MDDLQNIVNHTMTSITTPVSREVLRDLAEHTSVRWRSGKAPNEWCPRDRHLVCFDMYNPCLTHHNRGSMGHRTVDPDVFVQIVATFCPGTE